MTPSLVTARPPVTRGKRHGLLETRAASQRDRQPGVEGVSGAVVSTAEHAYRRNAYGGFVGYDQCSVFSQGHDDLFDSAANQPARDCLGSMSAPGLRPASTLASL